MSEPEVRVGIPSDLDKPLPRVREETGSLHFTWPEYDLIVDAERWHDDGQCELTFWHDTEDHTILLLQAVVKLLSTSNTSAVVRRLRDCAFELGVVPWDWVLTCVTFGVLKAARGGEPLETIWPSEDVSLKPDYLVDPLLYRNHPGVIFGDYGSGKSLLALAVGYVAQLPLRDNKLDFTTPEESTRCLYADYEDDKTSFQRRWSAIQKGFGVEASMPILYQRMTMSLADSVERLRQVIHKEKVELLIVDSLGPAARGNLNDPEPAIRYHAALRQLGITSLTLAHCSKDQLTRRRTIFGSVFFTNLARIVWECRSEQEPGEEEIIISLKNAKANLSSLHVALGYRLRFSDTIIAIARTDLKDTGLSGEAPLTMRIKDLLRSGDMPVRDIAYALDANEGSVKTIVNRLGKRGEATKVGDSWGLPH